jgi:phosphoribosylamine--glycine ligase
MNILLLGSGGREHALAWKTAQSPLCKKLFVAPGNAGTASEGINANININDFEAVAEFIHKNGINLVVVGPEEPLVKGITDFLQKHQLCEDIMVVGPNARGALLEGSKEFAKEFMKKYKIPTASYESFDADSFEQGVDFLRTLKPPYVLKADGLAAGKGVLILDTLDEAIQSLDDMLNKQAFGKASQKVVIEEFLEGIELSVFIATDGKNWVLLPEAKDYKRIGESDTGPNTGGMGAVSPVTFADKQFMDKVTKRIIQPTIDGLVKEKISYKGFIFIGLMNVKGNPFVIEYNVRLGDPETEAIVPRIDSDMVELFMAIAQQKIQDYKIKINPGYAVTVVLVSGGYPGSYEKGHSVSGIESVRESKVFFAGAETEKSTIVTSGGRVLAITSLDSSLSQARKKSIESAEKIHFSKKYFRKDIGLDVLK